MTKAETIVYRKIKANTDRKGWGLELSEIVEMTGFKASVVKETIKSLISSGYLTATVSHVGYHIFYNDAKWVKK